ncbi:SprB repeat-containing protein [Dyadobacter sp. NIV53]|uniref:SprB repeat-containing protein n=1 Tax=Dyadobacter sp. NIV53 TaxID=2861765 RepID=UPI001C86FEE8|nr:SprB repeat-containing protein [Dyadobacter sp. NIV53]
MTKLYTRFLKAVLLLITLAVLFPLVSTAQNKLFMNPVKYTDRQLEVYGSSCSDPSTIHLFINNAEIGSSQLTPLYIVGGYYAFEMDFGLMKPGDVFRATDDCGGITYQQTVKDDYVYVQVQGGSGFSGNGIGANDQYPPYSKLSTPVAIGKCSPVTIGSHGLVSYYVFSPQTNGTFKVNGTALTDGATGINPGGYDINFNGYQGTPVYSINTNGSITSNTSVKLESNTHFSGEIPIVLEYNHGGQDPAGDLSFGFKAMAIRQVNNAGFQIQKASLGGVLTSTSYSSGPASKFKVTYDGVYYRAYVDNVLIDEMRRFVEYGSSSGSLTPGSGAGLDYGTAVSWTGMQTGSQWVSVLVDGVLYTRQLFQVAADITINPIVTDIACSGSGSGQITVNTAGGLAPLQYALDGGAYVSSNVFTGLAAGNHVIKVRDASGCMATRNVTVGSSSAMLISVSAKTDETCASTANGMVTIGVTGGSAPYLYASDGGSFGNANSFPGLAAGVHTFSVKDNNGCIAALSDTVHTTSKLLAKVASLQNISCFGGNNGSITIGTAGSQVSGTLQFSVDNGVTFQASNIFSGLAAGTYSVVIKDKVCSTTINATITQPGDLTISADLQKAVSCNGLSDGAVQGLAASGTAPYQYSINGTSYANTNSFNGLPNGSYKIWTKDANGCVKESNIVAVTQPTAVSVSVLSKSDVTCFAAGNGSLTLAGSGGTVPYQFAKDGTSFQDSQVFGSLPAGNLIITLKDANGCKATVSGEILQPTDLVVTASNSATVSCFGGSNGQISAVASGGTGIIKYSINTTDFVTASSFTSLTAGSYHITIRDANGCQKISSAVTVVQASDIVPAFAKSDVKCFGGSDGSAAITAIGGTGAYTYSINGVNFQAAASFQSLVAGSYVFSVKDANSCVRTINGNITQPTDLVVSNSIIQQVLCYNGSSGIIQAASAGGTLPYQYSINAASYQALPTFSSLAVGTYKVWVKDGNGCIKETNSVTPNQPADLIPSILSQTAVKCNAGSDGSVQLAATGGVAPYTFSKDSVNYQSASLFSGLNATGFRFIVKDGNGCTKGVSAQVAQPLQAYTVTIASQASLTCYNQNIGHFEIKNNGGTSPYQVSLDNTTYQSSEVFASLSAGTYTVYGKDANNCLFTLPGIKLTQPIDILVSLLSKKDVDCEYYTRGEALVTAVGSNGNFSYTLGGSDFKFNPISPVTNATGFFDNLKAGDYTVSARDQAGCTKDFPVTIIPKSTNIRYEVTKSLPSGCTSEDGSISIVNANGGQPPYQYSISSQNSFSSNATFSGLLNGTYIVTVADELCSYKKEVDLSLPNSIKTSYTIDPVSCATPVANLNITNITGGNGNYQLSLNGSAFSGNRTFTGLHPNVYNLVVQDAPLSCKTATAIEIKEQNRADL